MSRMQSLRQLQPVLAYAAAHPEEDVSLAALARRAGMSRFHLHRLLTAAVRETPKQFTARVRLARAAVMLLRGDHSVLDVALACGFRSHEVFCRAFRRQFGITPRVYRLRGFAKPVSRTQGKRHAALVDRVAPCLGLYRITDATAERNPMAYSIATKELAPQPVLVSERRMKQSEIAQNLGEMFGRIFQHAQQNGVALAGAPFARYLEMGPGLMTVQAGFPVVAAPGSGEIAAGTLPGGRVAMTTHAGGYDKLSDAHAAIQEWMEAQGLTPAGAPWESYVTDPGEYPDPKDWKTEVYWPVKQ